MGFTVNLSPAELTALKDFRLILTKSDEGDGDWEIRCDELSNLNLTPEGDPLSGMTHYLPFEVYPGEVVLNLSEGDYAVPRKAGYETRMALTLFTLLAADYSGNYDLMNNILRNIPRVMGNQFEAMTTPQLVREYAMLYGEGPGRTDEQRDRFSNVRDELLMRGILDE